MEFPIRYIFSSEVSAEELDESFIDTSELDTDSSAANWSADSLHADPEEALKHFCFDELPNGYKFLSFLSRPTPPIHEDGELISKVFHVPELFHLGLLNYVAILSRTINSAPNRDSNWPYGRYLLRDIDGNVGPKLINNPAFLPTADGESDAPTIWGLPELHQLYDNLRRFGLNLCNFKDSINSAEIFGPWDGLLSILSKLEESEYPLVDKVSVKNVVLEIVNKYIRLRKYSFPRQKGAISDLTFIKQYFRSYKEIQSIDPDKWS